MQTPKVIEDSGNKEFSQLSLNNGKHIWLLKWFRDGEFYYSIGETKKDAERNQDREVKNVKPDWMLNLGSWQGKHTNETNNIQSIPGLKSWIYLNIPNGFAKSYEICPILYKQTLCCIFVNRNHPEADWLYYSKESKGNTLDAVREIVLQFILEAEVGFPIEFRKKNIKLQDWLKTWYNRLKAVNYDPN
jgi:hypothetical protein